MSTAAELRTTLKSALPAEASASQPARAFLFVPLVALIAAGTWAVVTLDWAWYLKLLVGVCMGNAYAVMGFLAHEVLHGSVVRSKRLQNFLGSIGLLPFLVSPHLWRTWHNRIHHGRTNQGNRDPDSFGTLTRYQRVPSTRFVAGLAPGTGTLPSYFFLFYWFTFHGQIVLWIQTRFMRDFEGYKRGRAVADTLVALALWLALAVWGGWAALVWAMLVPMMAGNFVVMSYIATNHFLRPMTAENNPLDNSMSLRSPAWIDAMHLHFSHHVEHHLFPNVSPRFAPLLRRLLEEQTGPRYVAPPHWKALLYLYKTPRLYADANTLIDPKTENTVSVQDVEGWLAA